MPGSQRLAARGQTFAGLQPHLAQPVRSWPALASQQRRTPEWPGSSPGSGSHRGPLPLSCRWPTVRGGLEGADAWLLFVFCPKPGLDPAAPRGRDSKDRITLPWRPLAHVVCDRQVRCFVRRSSWARGPPDGRGLRTRCCCRRLAVLRPPRAPAARQLRAAPVVAATPELCQSSAFRRRCERCPRRRSS